MSVELVDLAVGYRNRRRDTVVADRLTARARRGELTVLLGPNGCGKSTLIRTLCGLQRSLAGRVILDGTELTALAGDERARRVGVVLTERVDPGLLSARELAGLGRIPHLGLGGRMRPRDHAVVDWALTAVGAAPLADRPAAQLSDGERQRVLTARALAQQPGLLVLDEPTAFLDVSARAGLVELLHRLARDQDLTVLMSTHDLELALQVADRVWLMTPDGRLLDAAPEELMLAGHIGAVFDGDTLRFDPGSGVFVLRDVVAAPRPARIEAAEPLRTAIGRVLAREGWRVEDHDSAGAAEIVVAADAPAAITVHTGPGAARRTDLGALAPLVRALPQAAGHCVPAATAEAALADVAATGPYFAIGRGDTGDPDWRPLSALYADPTGLGAAIAGVADRIGAPEPRVAASTFHLGLAARLWSVWTGMLIGHRLHLDLSPDQVHFRFIDGQLRLHLPRVRAWRVDAAQPGLAAAVLDGHLTPFAAALRQAVPISAALLRGNVASALMGAARVYDAHRGAEAPGPAWRLASTICEGETLSGTVVFTPDANAYRRTSCCLYYRTPDAGLCGDCALDARPEPRAVRR